MRCVLQPKTLNNVGRGNPGLMGEPTAILLAPVATLQQWLGCRRSLSLWIGLVTRGGVLIVGMVNDS